MVRTAIHEPAPGTPEPAERAGAADLRIDAPALEIRNVRRVFGAHVAVDDVSLTVAKGEFVTLLGPSGCGKTTILRMVAGFEQPTRGSISVGGVPMAGTPPYRRPIGIVFQNLALFPHLTVAGNIAFGLEVLSRPRAEVDQHVTEILQLIGLSGLGPRRIHELSGGQRQRVALARALVTRPTVLLLDEPLGALDLKIRRQLQWELKRIQKQVGTTFVFVTHDQEEALTMSDRIAVMNQGRIEQLGTPADIYNQPRTPFVARFIGDTNLFEARISRIADGRAWADIEQLEACLPVGSLAVGIGVGDNVSVCIRPENVELTEPDLQPGALNGRLEEATYAGAHVRCRLRIKEAEILANVPAGPSRLARLEIGQELAIHWRGDDCTVQRSERKALP